MYFIQWTDAFLLKTWIGELVPSSFLLNLWRSITLLLCLRNIFLASFRFEAIAATIPTSTTSAITIITTEPKPKWAHALKSCPSTFIWMPEGAVENIVDAVEVEDVECSSMNLM